ncbi:hypothetical protein [Bradyrhizobium stylosanthis]|uniref:hypothetical protein n=1 Tax=Bradyrhizobium stylosanthis TaxID=1803665 RepID=UPI000ABE3B6B|nr:hypothetical protein [Bradyrhizobium stylosanthis]
MSQKEKAPAIVIRACGLKVAFGLATIGYLALTTGTSDVVMIDQRADITKLRQFLHTDLRASGLGIVLGGRGSDEGRDDAPAALD